MKKQALVVILFCGIVFAGSLLSLGVLQPRAITGAPQQRNKQQAQQNSGWEYARLVVNDQQVTWFIGNTNFVPRAETIAATNQQLGGKQPRADLATLLDTIGASGWELIIVNGNTWIFKRIPKK